ncbi:MAG: alanine racemase [Acidobacteriota bacterium]|nr:alanine racemase [Acidobacteriota bacterium]
MDMDNLRRTSRPTLMLDRRKVLSNIREMANKAGRAGVHFRPHFKTHQSAEIGDWFRTRGIEKITVSSLAMANYFAEHGWDDITVAFPANRLETHLINDLSGRIKLNLLVDHNDTIKYLDERLQHPVALWIKIDVGYGRAGIPWDQPAAVLDTARRIALSSKFNFKGLLTHAGHSYHAASAEEVLSIHRETKRRMIGLRNALEADGFQAEISVGDTPTASLADDFEGIDEIRPGNFVFYDLDQCRIGSCTPEQVAVALACPVVSKYPRRGDILIYGGSVHFSKEFITTADGGRCYGQLVTREEHGWGKPVEGAELYSLSQEHGKLRVTPELFDKIEIGEVLYFLPVHSCLTGNLHRCYVTLEGEPVYRFNSMP